MNSPRVLLIVNISLLYSIMGPLILFGIYVLFDSLVKKNHKTTENILPHKKKAPELWKEEEIRKYLSEPRS